MTRGLSVLVTLLVFLSAPAFGAPPVAKPNDTVNDGGPSAGEWSHAYVAFGGTPKYPKGFKHFDWVNPTHPMAERSTSATPTARRASTSSTRTRQRQRALRRADLSCSSRWPRGPATSRRPYTDWWPRRCGCRPTSRRSVPDPSEGALPQRDPVTAADVKHSFDMLMSKERAPDVSRPRWTSSKRRGRRRAHGQGRPQGQSDDAILSAHRGARVLAQVGRGADGKPKPFDQMVTEYPITSGPT